MDVSVLASKFVKIEVEAMSFSQMEAISSMEVMSFSGSYSFQWKQLHCFGGNRPFQRQLIL